MLRRILIFLVTVAIPFVVHAQLPELDSSKVQKKVNEILKAHAVSRSSRLRSCAAP